MLNTSQRLRERWLPRSHLNLQDAGLVRVQHRTLVRVLQPRLQDDRDGTSVIARLLDKHQQGFMRVVCLSHTHTHTH